MRLIERLLATYWGQRSGSLIWAAAFGGVLLMVSADPQQRSVVANYFDGSAMFAARQPLYNLDTAMGYLYSPAFAVLFTPFYRLGPYWGDFLWRIAAFSVLTFAAVRQVRLIKDDLPVWLLSMGLFLATPLSLGALRNGQSTILLAGACWLLVMAAMQRRWLATLVFSALAIVAKPTAIVTVLLVGATRPRLIMALTIAALLVILLPYAFAPSGYVTEITRSFLALLGGMSVAREQFLASDFTAPFAALGLEMPASVATAIRMIAAALSLLAALSLAQRANARLAALGIMVLAAYYMCVFNPRTEGNTYVLLAVPFGISVSLMMRRGGLRGMPLALGIVLFLAGIPGIEEHIRSFTNYWLQPVCSTLVFAGIMRWLWREASEPLPAMSGALHLRG